MERVKEHLPAQERIRTPAVTHSATHARELPASSRDEGLIAASPARFPDAFARAPIFSPTSAPRGPRVPLQMACAPGCGCAKCSAGGSSLFESIGLQKKSDLGGASPTEADGKAPALVDAEEVRRRLGGGTPVSAGIAQRFSAAYGHDLSGVRVHADSALPAQLGARAFTVGRDIAFAPGEFRPGTTEGDRLIGHELAHVVQQAGGAGVVQGAGLSEDTLEREADRAAEKAIAGGRVGKFSAVEQGAVQREKKKGIWEGIVDVAKDTGHAIGSVAEAGWDALVDQFWRLVRNVAPAAEPYLRDPSKLWKDIESAALRGIDALLGGVFSALPQDGLFGAVAIFFKTFIPTISRLTQAIAKDDHAGILAAVRGAIDAFSTMSSAVVAPTQGILQTIAGGLKKAFDVVGKPVVDLVKSLAKDAWGALQGFVDGVVSIEQKVGATLGAVWKSIKGALGIGSEESSKEGLWDRLVRRANDLWEKAKPTVLAGLDPLRTVGKVLVALSPVGPMVLAFEYAPKIVHGLKDLWSALAKPENIPRAREKVVSALHGISGLLKGASEHLGALAGAINKTLEGISKPLAEVVGVFGTTGFLKLLAAGARKLADLVEKGIAWAEANVPALAKKVGEFFQSLWRVAKPILDVVVKLVVVVANPLGIPILIGSQAWGRAPTWLKVVVIGFVLDLFIRFVERMPDGALAAGLGPLGAMIKHGVLGFLRRVYGEAGTNIAGAVAAANRIAKLAVGSIDFVLGLGKGILSGIWDGLVGPVEMIVMVIEGVAKVGEWLDRASQNLKGELRGIFSKARELASSVEDAFRPAIESVFKGSGPGFRKVLGMLGAVWGAIAGAASHVGGAVAGALLSYLMKPDFELGEKLGWVAGTVIFEVALAVLTGGASAALAAAKGPIARILQLVVKAHQYMGKVFEEILHLLGPIQRALGRAMHAISEIPAVKSVVSALERLFKEIEEAGARAIGKLGGDAAARGTTAAGREAATAVREAEAAAAKGESKAAKPKVEEPKAVFDAEPKTPKGDGALAETRHLELVDDLSKLDAEKAFIRQNPGQLQPSKVPGYAEEITLPNGHTWRRRSDGGWCRFSESGEFVGGVEPGQTGPAAESLEAKKAIAAFELQWAAEYEQYAERFPNTKIDKDRFIELRRAGQVFSVDELGRPHWKSEAAKPRKPANPILVHRAEPQWTHGKELSDAEHSALRGLADDLEAISKSAPAVGIEASERNLVTAEMTVNVELEGKSRSFRFHFTDGPGADAKKLFFISGPSVLDKTVVTADMQAFRGVAVGDVIGKEASELRQVFAAQLTDKAEQQYRHSETALAEALEGRPDRVRDALLAHIAGEEKITLEELKRRIRAGEMPKPRVSSVTVDFATTRSVCPICERNLARLQGGGVLPDVSAEAAEPFVKYAEKNPTFPKALENNLGELFEAGDIRVEAKATFLRPQSPGHALATEEVKARNAKPPSRERRRYSFDQVPAETLPESPTARPRSSPLCLL